MNVGIASSGRGRGTLSKTEQRDTALGLASSREELALEALIMLRDEERRRERRRAGAKTASRVVCHGKRDRSQRRVAWKQSEQGIRMGSVNTNKSICPRRLELQSNSSIIFSLDPAKLPSGLRHNVRPNHSRTIVPSTTHVSLHV